MTGKQIPITRRWMGWAASAVVMASAWTASAFGQSEAPPASPIPTQLPADDGGVQQAGCSSCGAAGGVMGCLPAWNGGCVPGRTEYCGGTCGSSCGPCSFGVFDYLCCPDPCYEGRWVAGANAAFFVDGARPITQMRIRYDGMINLRLLDRAEFYWAKENGKGPKVTDGNGIKSEPSAQYNNLSILTEGATGTFGLAVEMPYLSIDPEVSDHSAGFGDLNITTKSLLLDRELLQFAFQFRTYVPTGNFTKGLGNGHVSLEPSLLAAVHLACDTYLQAQLSEWIPLGGTADYEGSILHYHMSVNRVLARPWASLQVIGTAEFNGYSFQAGKFTDQFGASILASGDSYLSAGPGIRFVLCDRLDIGVATAWQLSGHLWPEQVIRTEFHWRF